MALLEIEALSAYYGMAQALDAVSLHVEEGAIAGLIGPNGAGKSTLMDSLLGLTHTTGMVRFAGETIEGLGSADRVRRGIGYAPERAHLFPFMSVRENLLAGAYTARDDIDANLARVHSLFPVLESRARQETGTQSGGERQMVSLGRALMSSPRLLLVDEPTIGLAPKVCLDIAAALRTLNETTGLTILIAEQNVNFCLSLASEVHVLETGRLRTSGTAAALRDDPALRAAYFGS